MDNLNDIDEFDFDNKRRITNGKKFKTIEHSARLRVYDKENGFCLRLTGKGANKVADDITKLCDKIIGNEETQDGSE